MMKTFDALFEGELVLGVPPLADEYARKAPGDQDDPGQGDWCNR